MAEAMAATRYAMEEEPEGMGMMASSSVSAEEASVGEGHDDCDSFVQGRGGPLRKRERRRGPRVPKAKRTTHAPKEDQKFSELEVEGTGNEEK
jgi:hypothetical protein